MTENQIAKQILDGAFVVHTKLGPGLFESVYEVVLAHELRKRGLTVERQKPMPIVMMAFGLMKLSAQIWL
jgi:GxxExxY protein